MEAQRSYLTKQRVYKNTGFKKNFLEVFQSDSTINEMKILLQWLNIGFEQESTNLKKGQLEQSSEKQREKKCEDK